MMRKGAWAEKKALKVWASFRGGLGDYGAQLAYDEHARAIRIVKAEIKYAAHAEQKTKLNRELNAYWQGKLDGAENILVDLQRGRGGKG